MLDAIGQVVDTKEGSIEVETDSNHVIVRIKEKPDEQMEGSAKEFTCEWKEPFKNGKTIYKTELSKPNGDNSNASFTIEGKDGKITILLVIDKLEGRKIRI